MPIISVTYRDGAGRARSPPARPARSGRRLTAGTGRPYVVMMVGCHGRGDGRVMVEGDNRGVTVGGDGRNKTWTVA